MRETICGFHPQPLHESLTIRRASERSGGLCGGCRDALSCGVTRELAAGVGKLLVFGIIVAIGMSLGGLTGYALNPARDLGPRIAHAILPIKGKGSSNFKYGLIVPIFGPIIGGIVAVLLYNVIPW